MPKKDPRVDAYIAKAADFAKPILNHLREVVHAACPEVEETMKWNFPHFMHKGILCSMGAFKHHCTFGFWKGDQVLGQRNGKDSAHGQFGRLTSVSELPADDVLTRYIKKGVQLNRSGIRKAAPVRPKVNEELIVPDDLAAALDRNKRALAAFDGMSPSHKREYVEWIVGAKREATRAQRLKTAVEWMSEAKPRYWKYLDD